MKVDFCARKSVALGRQGRADPFQRHGAWPSMSGAPTAGRDHNQSRCWLSSAPCHKSCPERGLQQVRGRARVAHLRQTKLYSVSTRVGNHLGSPSVGCFFFAALLATVFTLMSLELCSSAQSFCTPPHQGAWALVQLQDFCELSVGEYTIALTSRLIRNH